MKERNLETGCRYARFGGSVVNNRLSDECIGGAHDDCNFLWCTCLHHSAAQFKAEHPQLKSLSECESEKREMEAA